MGPQRLRWFSSGKSFCCLENKPRNLRTRYNAYRRCTGSCQDAESWHHLPLRMVNENLLVLPTFRTPPGMAYQHGLTDLLPYAFTMLEELRKSNMKLVPWPPKSMEDQRTIIHVVNKVMLYIIYIILYNYIYTQYILHIYVLYRYMAIYIYINITYHIPYL